MSNHPRVWTNGISVEEKEGQRSEMDFLVMCRVGVEWTLNTVTVGVFVWWHLMNDRKALLNIHAHVTIWAHISSPIFSKSSLKAIQDSFSTPGNKEREICQGNVWAMCKQWGCWRGPSSTRLMTEHSSLTSLTSWRWWCWANLWERAVELGIEPVWAEAVVLSVNVPSCS